MVEFDNVAQVAITQGTNDQILEVTNAQLNSTYAINIARTSTVDLVSFEDASGAADTVNLSVTGAGSKTTARAAFDVSDLAVEGVALQTSGTNFLTINNGSNVATYTINGSGTNDIVVDDAAATMTVDMSGTTGANTLRVGSLLTSLDTIIGGSGTDTLVATPNAGTTYATVSGVENLSFVFDTAGATQDLRNVTGATTLNLTGAESATVARANATIATVNMKSETSAAADDVSVTYATGSNSAVTLNVGATNTAGDATVTAGDVTIASNKGALTVNSIGDAQNTLDNLTANSATTLTVLSTTDLALTADLKATAATSASITSDGGDLSVGNDVVLTKATDITLTAADGAIAITGNLLTEGNLVQIALAASAANANDITVGLVDADFASLVSAEAAGGADITVSDLIITGKDNAGDDAATEVALTALGTGTVVTLSDITAALATTLDQVTLTSDADGTISFNATDGDLTITDIDATASAGTLTINVSTLAAGTSVSTGAGDTTATLSGNADTYVGGSGADEVWGMSAADDITLGGGHDILGLTTNATTDVVSDFVAGATTVTSSDVAEFSLAAFNALVADVIYGDGSNVAVSDGSVLALTAATDISANSTSNLLVLSGATYASTGAVETALEAGGGRQLTLDNGAGDALMIAYQDASGNVQIATLTITSANVGDTIAAGDSTVANVATLVGVTIGDLASANFAFVA